MTEAEVANPVLLENEIEILIVSPEVLVTLVITLINEIRMTDLRNDQHDLSLFFLTN